jgi:hypothetical protein
MRTLLAFALAALLAGGQEPADELEESPEEVLDQLAELVEGYEAFSLVYSLYAEGELMMEMELVYRAPDSAVLQMKTPEMSTTNWIVEGVWAMQLDGPDGLFFGTVDVNDVLAQSRDVRLALHEAFSEGETFPETPLPIFHIHPGDHDADGQPTFTVNFAFETRRKAFFCWNGEHRDRYEEITLEPGHVVLHAPGEDNVLKIARYQSAGFLELASGQGKKGLVRLRLDGLEMEADEERLTIPSKPEGAQDLPEGMLGGFEMLGSLAFWRRSIYAVSRNLDRGEIEWDDDTRERLAEVFTVLHRHKLPGHYEEWVQGQNERVREFAAWIAERIDDPDLDRAELTEKVATYKARLTEFCAQATDAYLQSLTLPVEDDEWGPPFQELEQGVVRDLFAETITDPLLEEFQAEVESQL